MTEDVVMRQVWAAKEAVARQFNYDVRAMGRYFQSLDQPGTHPVVDVAAEVARLDRELEETQGHAAPVVENEILREIRQYREEHARRFNYDVKAIMEDARIRSEQGDWPIHRWHPPRPEAITEADPAPESLLKMPPTFEDI